MSSDKILDVSLEELSNKLRELKSQITNLLFTLENEPDKLDRSTVLDHYTVITSQLSNITRQLKQDNMPPLRNYSLFPLKLTPELDPELEHMTEGRLRIFNHEVAPDYLRTKAEPDIEQTENQIEARVSQLQPETLSRQITSLNKMVGTVCDMVEKFKVQMEADSIDKQLPQTYSTEDTHTLLAALNYGISLKLPDLNVLPSGQAQASPSAVSTTSGSAANTPVAAGQVNANTVNKPAPPVVKTTIKAGGMGPQFGR